jgi:type I restriction enzyme S subunit
MADLHYADDNWLGKTPATWSVVPAKSLFSNPVERNHADDVHLTPSQKFGVLPQSDYMEITGNRVVLNLSGADNMRHVEPGDFVSHLRSFQGGLEYSPYKGKVSSAYTVLRPKRPLEPRFYKHLFKSSRYVQGLSTTTEQLRDGQSIRYEQFALLRLPYPPLEEQRAIANFLDRELTQIDELIDRQEQLISIVLERLNGVLYEAVCGTRFESTSPTAVSVEWFHSFPQDWSVKRVSAIAKIINGHPFDSETFSDNQEGMPLVRIRDLIAESFETFVPRETTPKSSLIRDGDLLIGMDGDFNVKLWNRGEAALNQRVCLLRCHETALARYLAIALPFALKRINDLTYATTVKHLSSGQVAKIKVPVPPIAELERVSREIEEKVASAGLLVERASALIAVSKERRQALINSAVTGKIDVRGKN